LHYYRINIFKKSYYTNLEISMASNWQLQLYLHFTSIIMLGNIRGSHTFSKSIASIKNESLWSKIGANRELLSMKKVCPHPFLCFCKYENGKCKKCSCVEEDQCSNFWACTRFVASIATSMPIVVIVEWYYYCDGVLTHWLRRTQHVKGDSNMNHLHEKSSSLFFISRGK